MKQVEMFTKLIHYSSFLDESDLEPTLEFKYILLVDSNGQIVKKLTMFGKPVIPNLVEQVSKYAIFDKLFISKINNEPFLILKKRAVDKKGNFFAYILLLSRIDNSIMKRSYMIHPHDSIHALEDEGSSTVIASNQPDILPVGIKVNELTNDYIIIRRHLPDISQNGIRLAFLSLKNKDDIKTDLRDMVDRNRKQVALTALAFILSFSLVAYIFSRVINKIALSLYKTSKEEFGIDLYTDHKGDELVFITAQIRKLFTELAALRNALKIESNKFMKFYQIVQQSPDSIVITDTESNIEYINQRFTEISGYTHEEVIGKTPSMLKSGRHTKEFYQKLWNTILSGDTWKGEMLNKKKNGDLYWESTFIFPLISNDGDVINYVAIKEEITNKKQLELELGIYKAHLEEVVAERTVQVIERDAELRDSQNTLLALMNAITESVLLITKDGIVLTINETGARRIGRTPNAMIGRNLFEFFPHDIAMSRKQIANRVINEKTPVENEDTRNGRRFSQNFYPVFDKKGNVISIAIFAIDITEKRRQEKKATLFLQAVEAALDGIQLVDLDGKVFYSNKAVANMLGYSVEEISGMSSSDLNDDPTIAEQVIIPTVLRDGLWSGELKAKRKDATTIDVWLNVSLIKDDNGNIIYLLGVSKDITEQKRYEETLRQYEDIVSASKEQISLIDRNYVYRAVNKTHSVVHNRSKDEIIGHSVEELWGSKVFYDSVKPILDRCLSGEVVNYQAWFDVASMGKRYMDVYYYPHYDKNGVVAGVVVSGRDMTDKKKAEDELKSVAKFPAENPNPVMQISRDARILYSNQSGFDFLGKWGITDNLPPYMHEIIESSLETGISDDIEIIASDDTFLFSVVPIKEYGHVNLYGRKITGLKNTEMILKLQQEEIRNINLDLERKIKEEVDKNRQKDTIMFQQSRLASMGEMVSYIAHQWRQPLNALNIMLFNIEDVCHIEEGDPELLNNLLKDATAIILKMSTTIDDFRNFFKHSKEKVLFSVKNIIAETLAIVEPSFKFHNINVTLIDNDDIFITGFSNEYSQVILNIMNNAKDAILEKKITAGKITIAFYEDNQGSVVTITDNAGGIAPDIMDRIFEPYFTTKMEGKGTGIGLYMSKMIIEEHMNGSITATNTTDGAMFTIIVPQ
ncbi:MAG: PAS domain S-box protein [Nitrospirae bacterium]|nr:PAS domain S-box protein [Nitrospirota bacterium]